jgi:hypothetical protein
MIRIACDQCGQPLRAPDDLAGKHGRCGHCGAVNPVPNALAVGVGVKRPSPFRSADLPTRSAIEGTTDVSAAAFRATGPADPHALDRPPDPREFVDRITSQITQAAAAFPLLPESAPPTVNPPPPPASNPTGSDEPVLEDDDGEEPEVYDVTVLPTDHDGRAAVIVALATGVLFGFALGLLAAKWLLVR